MTVPSEKPTSPIRAITFDVFGTILDLGSAAWAKPYANAIAAINKGIAPYRPIETIFADINADWPSLSLYPDVMPGLMHLKKNFVIAPLSNAGLIVGEAMRERFELPWTMIVATESAMAYKPDPKVYERAVNQLQFKPREILHVAAHRYDLRAAKKLGFATALVLRPGAKDDPRSTDRFDFTVHGIYELAAWLGMNPRWVVSVLALPEPKKSRKASHYVFHIDAISSDQAVAAGRVLVESMCPVKDGWTHHIAAMHSGSVSLDAECVNKLLALRP